MKTRTKKLFLTAGFAAGALVASTPEAHAIDWIIKNPGSHPGKSVELEPHLNFIFYRAGWGRSFYGRGYGNTEVGGGFRASIELADPMFIPKINNSIAISFGLDFNSCRFYCGNRFELWSPVTLQWNFFLTRKWSAFAELGGIIHSDGFFDRNVWIDPTFFLGTRIHFTDSVALTFRVGSPWIGVGVSFYVGS
jgi:hypothetical protein